MFSVGYTAVSVADVWGLLLNFATTSLSPPTRPACRHTHMYMQAHTLRNFLAGIQPAVAGRQLVDYGCARRPGHRGADDRVHTLLGFGEMPDQEEEV